MSTIIFLKLNKIVNKAQQILFILLGVFIMRCDKQKSKKIELQYEK